MLLLLTLACTPDAPGPAAPGSRSAELAARAGELSTRARTLAERAGEIEGAIDEYRTADPARRAEIAARIRTIADDVAAEAHALEDRVSRMEGDARAWPAEAPAAEPAPEPD